MCSINFPRDRRVFAFSCTVSREWKSLKNCVWGTFHSYFSYYVALKRKFDTFFVAKIGAG